MTVIAIALLSLAVAAVTPNTVWPLKLATPGGEVILPDARAKQAHDENRYSAARRVDNMLYVSGVIVERRPDEGSDVQAFKLQTRRAFERLKQILEASGASFRDVAMINSFHVWQGPNFDGSRDQQFAAFEEVAGEFLKPPYPAQTAVGTTGLLSDGGIVEVQFIVRPPLTNSGAR